MNIFTDTGPQGEPEGVNRLPFFCPFSSFCIPALSCPGKPKENSTFFINHHRCEAAASEPLERPLAYLSWIPCLICRCTTHSATPRSFHYLRQSFSLMCPCIFGTFWASFLTSAAHKKASLDSSSTRDQFVRSSLQQGSVRSWTVSVWSSTHTTFSMSSNDRSHHRRLVIIKLQSSRG